MRYIINGTLVEQDHTEASKACDHHIIKQSKEEMIKDTRYRYCEKCGMIAHEDGSFAHCCGMQWCKCMQ